MHARQSWTGGALLAACFLALSPAAAQPLPDSEKIERLERETELLQRQLKQQAELVRRQLKQQTEVQTQLKALQAEIAQTKKMAAKVEAVQPGYAVATPASNPANSPSLKEPPQPAGVKVTLGGYVAAETVFRTRNQVNDMATAFNAIPYPYSPLYKEHEFHGTARQSQISLLAEGNIDAAQKLAGYLEFDFLGVGTSSNPLVYGSVLAFWFDVRYRTYRSIPGQVPFSHHQSDMTERAFHE